MFLRCGSELIARQTALRLHDVSFTMATYRKLCLIRMGIDNEESQNDTTALHNRNVPS